MKVQDLFEERLKDYTTRLVKSLNIKELGRGAFSTVFQHPAYHNVSVKITRDADPHYILWLRECEKHQHNPWFPKIVGIHKVMFHGDDVDRKVMARDELNDAALEGRHIVFMQKLRPIKPAENKKAAQYIAAQLPAKFFMSEDESLRLQRLRWGRRGDAVRAELRAKGIRYFTTIKDVKYIDDIHEQMWEDVITYSKDKNLVELARVLARIGTDDLHSGNIMMRDDEGGAQHPVITDPVAS
jgi:hypothetical protein